MNPKIFSLIILVICTLLLGRFCDIMAESDNTDIYSNSFSEYIGNTNPNSAVTSGAILTLDGQPMVRHLYFEKDDTGEYQEIVDDNRGDGNDMYISTDPAYSSVVGTNGSEGIMTSLESILKAYNTPSNIKQQRGNEIVSTIVSSAQITAYDRISKYADDEVFVSLSVVNADGAVLVDASSTSASEFEFENRIKDFYMNKTDSYPDFPDERKVARHDLGYYPEYVGSEFKVITARILEQNKDLLLRAGREWTISEEEFMDRPSVFVNGEMIKNHDYSADSAITAINYPVSDNDGEPYRILNFNEAVVRSSNTYFLRHAMTMGLDNYYNELKKLFFINTPFETEIAQMPPMEINDDNIAKVVYGQEAKLSTIQYCTLYNLALSGRCYLPFEVAEIYTPDKDCIYHAVPREIEKYRINIDKSNDPVKEALNEAFLSYITNSSLSDIAHPECFCAKSGTAIKLEGDNGTENRTMALGVFNNSGELIMSGSVGIYCNPTNKPVSNAELLSMLIDVFYSLKVIE